MNLRFRALFLAPSFAALLSLTGCSNVACETCGGAGGGTSTSSTASSTTSGPGCTSVDGTLQGTVTLFAAEGDPSSAKAPKALIELRRSPKDAPLQAMADESGKFTVDIEAGAWIVGGTSADGYCTTMLPRTVTVAACQVTISDVILESCVN